MRYWTLPIVVAVALTFVSTSGDPARAAGTSLRICNQSASQITVAVSYASSGPNDTAALLTGPTVSIGWWVISAGQCDSMANPFAARHLYWWAYTSAGPAWADTDAGYTHFCVPDINEANVPQFTYEEENASADACANGPPDAAGPNMWVMAREADVDVDATVDYSQ